MTPEDFINEAIRLTNEKWEKFYRIESFCRDVHWMIILFLTVAVLILYRMLGFI